MPPELEPPAVESSAPPGGAIAAPDGSSPAPDWTSAIPADLAKDGLWSKYAGKPTADVLRAFHGAASYQGRSIALPPKDAKPEDIAKWKTEHLLPKLREAGMAGALGDVPEAPTGYKVTRPEIAADLGWDDALEQGFLGVAHAAALTQAQVDAVLGWYSTEIGGALVRDMQTQFQEGAKALQDEWGRNYEPFLGRVVNFSQKTFSPETRAMFEKTGVANDPGFIKELFALAGQHVEAGLMRGQPGDAYSATDFSARANTILAEMDRLNPGSAQYEALASEYRALFQRQYGTRPAAA